MKKENSTREKEVLEKVFEGNTRHTTFEKEELSLIKELSGDNDNALHVVGDMIFTFGNSKGYLMDMLEELYKNDIKGERLISLYLKCNKDVVELAYKIEEDRINLLRIDTD